MDEGYVHEKRGHVPASGVSRSRVISATLNPVSPVSQHTSALTCDFTANPMAGPKTSCLLRLLALPTGPQRAAAVLRSP